MTETFDFFPANDPDEFRLESLTSMTARRDEFAYRLKNGGYSSELIRRILESNVAELDLEIQNHPDYSSIDDSAA